MTRPGIVGPRRRLYRILVGRAPAGQGGRCTATPASRVRSPLACAAALALAACEVAPPVAEPSITESMAQAAAFAQAGQHQPAAQRYDAVAELTRGATRDRLLLAAAEQWYAAGDLDRTRARLAAVGGELTRDESARLALLSARIAMDSGEAAAALQALSRLPDPPPASLAAEVLGLRADAQFALDRPVAAVETLIERGKLASTPEQRLANERRMWNGLLAVASRDALPERVAGIDATTAGWLELGRIGGRAGRNPFGARRDIADWQQRFAGHPANRALIAEIIAQFRDVLDYPRQVALILPLSGRQQAAAQAVRDGFLAAYFQQDEEVAPPAVKIYDESVLGGAGAVRRAALDGADLIVGPLTKTAVREAAETSDGTTVTLALNYLPDGSTAPQGFYQFGLAPEDEASQAAARMVAEGQHLAVALAPNNDWGRRLLSSFRNSLEQHGGALLDYRFFDANGRDFSAPITGLLLLDESRARHRKLAKALGVSLEFEPRRRGDVRAIFLAAEPGQARLIRPQLKFYFAGDLPIYSNSAVFEPGGSNSELDGVYVPDAPWLLHPDETATRIRATFERLWPRAPGSRSRLHALGFDAYRLVPLLYNRAGVLGSPVPGMTGDLSLDQQGRIHRTLDWALITRGEARPLQVAAEEEPLP